MTTNGITASVSSAIQTVGSHVPSLPELGAFGFTPKNLFPYACLIIGGGLLYQAINKRYIVIASVEHDGDYRIQLNLQPGGTVA